MSNFGQGVAAVAGAVVGFVVGGPTGAAYGFQIGLLAGSALFPTQLPGVTGPRLEDIDQTAADPGSPIPIPFGTIALTGATIWLGPVVEETETDTVGGKGAPEQEVTSYTYRQSIAVGVCEGPVTSVLRIWENGKLVYDLREQQAGETDDDYAARLEASTDYATGFDLYLGTEEQQPDPTIEADKGAGNVPAFRGLAYIVYPDRALRDDQGRRHPLFRFEVSNRPAQVPLVVFTASGTYARPAGLASATVTATGGGGGGAGGGAIAGNGFPRSGGGGGGGGLSEVTLPAASIPSTVTVTVGLGGLGGDGAYDDAGVDTVGESGTDGGASSFGALLTASGGEGGGKDANRVLGGVGGAGTTENGGNGGDGDSSNTTQNNTPGGSTTRAPAGGGGGGTTRTFDECLETPAGGNTAVLNGGTGGQCEAQPGGANGTTGGPGDDSQNYEGGAGGGGGGAASANFSANPGPADAGGGGRGGRYGAGGGGGGSAQGRVSSDPLATARGGPGADGADGVVVVWQMFASDPYSLADVVEGIAHRAGLYDIDVEDLRAIPIDGYAVGRPMPARAALEPLRSFGYFDVVESGAVLKFRVRGGAAALTLAAADLGAQPAGDAPGPAITTRKLQDVELPRQVRVRFQDTGRDYEGGEQLSPVRLTTEAENDITVDLPIAMSGTRAAEIAEVLWSDAWRSRWVHTLAIEGRYLELEPTDVLEVPVDGRVQRMRIVSIEDDGGEVRRLELVRDDDGAYVSYAVAAEPERRPTEITRLNSTELVLLDLPALRDADNDAGIYAAAYPTGVGTRWDGCVVYRSSDGGETFASAGAIVTPVTAGRLAAALADGIASTFDEAATLTVDLDYGELESRTEAAVLEGANAAAIGDDGRWQIIQFRTAEQITPTRYRLSGILRGRRGTENFTGTSRSGDRFVLLSTGAVARLPLETAAIGAARQYRGVTIGAAYSSGTVQAFTGRGVALRCFAPVEVALEDQPNGDIRITWIRRNRLGQELRDGVEIPMSEAAELYEVDLFPLSDVTVPLRTLSSSSESATYTAEQQAEDFGSPAATAATLAVAVYQLSNVVGRGLPGYYPADAFAVELDEDVAADADRSASLDYLEFIKGDYPDSSAIGRTVEYRHRNAASGFVVDAQLYGTANTVLRRFEDGETESSGGAGALYVVALASDSDARYFYVAQLYGGTTLNGSGPGIIRKIDANAFSPGGILSGVTVASAAGVGLSGDPESLVVLGDYLYAAAPFAQAIYKFNRSDLTLAATLSTAYRPWTLAARGTELWAVERARPSPHLWRVDPDSGATLTDYTLTDGFPIDLAIAGDFAYIVSPDSAALAKYSLISGARQSFELDLSGEDFSTLRNYLTLDGSRLSVARAPTVYVIDTASDTQLAP